MVFQDQARQKTFLITAGIICAVLQVGFAPHIHLFNGHPNFALIFSGLAMATLSSTPSVLCGFFAGVFFDLVGAGPFGLMAFCLTGMNFLCGIDSAKRMGESWLETFRLFCLCALCVELISLIGETIVGDVNFGMAFLLAFLPAVFWDCLFSLPFFYVLGRLTTTASTGKTAAPASKYAEKNFSVGKKESSRFSRNTYGPQRKKAKKGEGLFSGKKKTSSFSKGKNRYSHSGLR